MKKSNFHYYLSRICSVVLFTLSLLVFSACDSDGGGSSPSGDGAPGDEAPVIVPPNNKNAEFLLTVGPQGVNNYLVIVGITDAVPGSSVKQSNAQNTFNGTINQAGIYQKEHAAYPAGSGQVTVIVTLTDPEGEVLIKELKKQIPNAPLDELAP
jgi:hypothetical protein